MTNFEDQPPPAVGAYWIKEEDYPALLKITNKWGNMAPTLGKLAKEIKEVVNGT